MGFVEEVRPFGQGPKLFQTVEQLPKDAGVLPAPEDLA